MAFSARPPSGLTPEGRYPRGRDTAIHIGVVKKNDDIQKMGRLAVWIPEFGGDPDDPKFWITVGYASPFAGATEVEKTVAGSQTLDGTQKSYGFWMVPPDLDNQVLVCFVNGNPSQGFWFACLYAQNMNHMVPGIPVNKSFSSDPNKPSLPPVAEYNKKTSQNPDDPLRAVYTPLDDGLTKQGLYTEAEEAQFEYDRIGTQKKIQDILTKKKDDSGFDQGAFARSLLSAQQQIWTGMMSQFLGGMGAGNSLQTHALEGLTLQQTGVLREVAQHLRPRGPSGRVLDEAAFG